MYRDIVNTLAEKRLVAIVRGLDTRKVCPVTNALLEGGVRVLEVTFDTPGAKEMIQTVKKEYGAQLLVGAGTVLDPETARTAILAGADFLLAPTLNVDMIRLCNRYGRVAVPGVMTPTEMLTATEAGAGMVKLFPAGALGPGYLKDVLGPLKQLSIMAVGGVNLSNAAAFLNAGADALGIASDLVAKKLVDAEDYAEIRRRAAAFTQIVTECKGE